MNGNLTLRLKLGEIPLLGNFNLIYASKFFSFEEIYVHPSYRTRSYPSLEANTAGRDLAQRTLLVGNAGRALGRGEILQRVWGHGVFVTGRSIDRCVNTLRKKIEPDAKRPRYIIIVRDVGYRFAGVEAASAISG